MRDKEKEETDKRSMKKMSLETYLFKRISTETHEEKK